ncbi:MAG TPA: AIM24 family protein, partial [Candidatus Dormibacteraeota bacterium]|nr:AIM24 family protein [Candidatus Dormibacteraeota bacterium]
ELDVREHAFLLASHTIAYSYVRIQGLRNILFGGQGMFMDRFVTGEVPGLLLLHGYGNVFERELQAGESVLLEPGNAFVRALQQGETMLIKPTSLLYKDPTVQMQLHFEHPGGTWQSWRSWGNRYLWLRMHGPGRVAVESAAPHFHDPGRNISRMSPATKTQW